MLLGALPLRGNGLAAKHPKLAKWFNSTAETPAMKATHPPAA
jgi:hypothetical protein